MTLPAGGDELLRRIGLAFNRFDNRVVEAAEMKPEWKKYVPQEQQRLIAEQRAAAMEKNSKEYAELSADMDAYREKCRLEVEKKLKPLQYSTFTHEREQGRAAEEKAGRVVKAVGVKNIEAEYRKAMSLNQLDYASELLHWAELLSDKNSVDNLFLRRLNAEHEAAAGVTELHRSLGVLVARFEILKYGNPFSPRSRHITHQGMFYKTDPEFAAHLKGLVNPNP